MGRGRFIYVSRLILKFNVKNSAATHSGSSCFVEKLVQSKKLMVNYSSPSFFGQKHVQPKKLMVNYSISSFFDQKHVQSKKLDQAAEPGLLACLLAGWPPELPPGGNF